MLVGHPETFLNAVLHEHIVMPNHIHGIVELTQNDVSNVGAENFLPLQPPNESPANESSRNKFQKMIPRSIGSIVKGFKIGVTKWSRTNPVEAENFLPLQKLWQRNYHEHIIRDEKSYQSISEYIINNPQSWEEDKFYNIG